MLNYENYFTYEPWQFAFVDHMLTLGYAAMAAGFVYFLATMYQLSPKYRIVSVLGAVVMASAFFELRELSELWRASFEFDPATRLYLPVTDPSAPDAVALTTPDAGAAVMSARAGSARPAFSNGFRYTNWSIDVPVLLTQLLLVGGIAGARFRSMWLQFVVAGVLMIYTGYVGQLYEAGARTGDTGQLFVWGTISTVFFAWILVLTWKATYGVLDNLPVDARGTTKGVFWLLLFSWLLYPGGYLMPVLWWDANGVLSRQLIYTVADVVSKVIYGVMLSYVAAKVSAAEGYAPAVASVGSADAHATTAPPAENI